MAFARPASLEAVCGVGLLRDSKQAASMEKQAQAGPQIAAG
jgi:hypothetical protein